MVRISVLNDALRSLSNAEKRGHRQVLVRPSSKVVIKFLSLMAKKGTGAKMHRLGVEGGGGGGADGGRLLDPPGRRGPPPLGGGGAAVLSGLPSAARARPDDTR